jgi:hypothetical protein
MNALIKCKNNILPFETDNDKEIYENFENSVLKKNKNNEPDTSKIP